VIAAVWWWLAIATPPAILDWTAVIKRSHRAELITKPATMAALVVAAGFAQPRHSGVHGWLVLALLFGLAGGLALALDHGSDHENFFVAGLGSFLIGHICFSVAMVRHGTEAIGIGFGIALGVILASVFGFQIVRGANRQGGLPLAIAIAVYIWALATMLALGVGTASLLIAYGALVFAASDLVLGTDRLVAPKEWAPITVMVSYHVAQVLLLIGLAR
jgi:uncharacterized membrane protein YhhN